MIVREGRTAAPMIVGALVVFVPDGCTYGEASTAASRDNVPTFEEAMKAGKILGEVKTWKWNVEYKTVTKEGVSWETQRYESRDYKILTKVKPQFSTQDIVPEAWALENGLAVIPAQGKTARPFSNASGCLRGHLYISVLDSYRTRGEDGEVAQIYLRGDLSLQDHTENNSDLKTINYEFSVTRFPADGFKNIGLNPDLA